MNITQIHQEATAAAEKAAADMLNKIGGDCGACGFAWVEVFDVKLNTKLGKELQKIGFRRPYTGAPVQLWNPSRSPVQNIDVKEVGAQAYAMVLRAHGLNAYMNSRLD